MASFKVLDPSGTTEITKLHAPRLESLENKKFIEGLSSRDAKIKETGVHRPAMIQVEASGFEAALDTMNRQYLVNTWGRWLAAERLDRRAGKLDLARHGLAA